MSSFWNEGVLPDQARIDELIRERQRAQAEADGAEAKTRAPKVDPLDPLDWSRIIARMGRSERRFADELAKEAAARR